MKARQKGKQSLKFESIFYYEKETRRDCECIEPYLWFVFDEVSEFNHDQIAALSRLTKYSQEIGLYGDV